MGPHASSAEAGAGGMRGGGGGDMRTEVQMQRHTAGGWPPAALAR